MNDSILEQALSSWDQKSTAGITAIYQRFAEQTDFVQLLIELIRKDSTAVGSTWLLKHYLECGGKLDAEQVASVYGSVEHLTQWQARLHLLQSMPDMPVPEPHRAPVELFVRKGLSDENKFVRAWSYNGLFELALIYSDLRDETQTVLSMALQDEAPSVKARVRNLLQQGMP